MTVETELAWAAGFFDGEGCARLHANRKDGRKTYYSLNLSVAQKDRQPLERFAVAVGCGAVHGPYRRIGTPMFSWRTHNIAGFERVVSLLWPYLSEPKRAQIRSVIDGYDEQWRNGTRGLARTGAALQRLLVRTAS